MPPFVPGIVPGTNWVCPRDKPGEIGLPLCRIRRIPGFALFFTGFVPGTNWVCPWDNSGENWDQPDKKVYVYVPFSCLNGCCSIPKNEKRKCNRSAIQKCKSVMGPIRLHPYLPPLQPAGLFIPKNNNYTLSMTPGQEI